ncbi:TIGR02391 family protein [Curtobacterium sp. 20TX0008]|uniref:TIGR02391 family protein n=1 Tax=Curtobacterium sp. 20TX0008 TaxID=3022018 RepID=UPI00232F914F|nr:TIGR02391 family protein [Curtobacterium sp. 20TX0008]MDB6426200.1 TIGR02391 family protein [Curtobacterium sp. 20TX0008]
MGDFASPVGSKSEIVAAAQIVEKILDRVLPRWRSDVEVDNKGRWQQHREAAQRAVVEIESRALLAEKLGDNAPNLNAGGLHPWVWESAKSLWQSGHFREAVRAAAVKINAETQNKLDRRDLSEAALIQFAFSNDAPSPGKARLRPTGDDGGRTALSLRRGIAAYAEGCFAAIRNPLSHDEGDLPEQEALELLAALSVLARWIDRSTVVSV